MRLRAALRAISGESESPAATSVASRVGSLGALGAVSTWFFRRFAQYVAQALHGRVDAVIELDYRVIRPELLTDFLAKNDFAGTFEQRDQYLERLVLETDPEIVLTQFGAAQIELKRSEPNHGSGVTGLMFVFQLRSEV
jgi:hypothetical protein